MYKIYEEDNFAKSVRQICAADAEFIIRKLKEYVYPQLSQEPHRGANIKKLKGYVPDTWRYRLGHYRILFHINDKEKIVIVLTVGQRKEVYK